ncbi:RHS repeat-associated core domain-containing protein [Pseudomonas mosselii]|uniref:RHS repeat-associated core domain-containing protein n=1 Tax=Pseudomonas mosselii TaxID=78327 RepID=UPI000A2553FF|nr:RHS repeat-associated core domain-containing protein [Pseudomonas mosselii]MDH1657904.1 RHS repeat-associated core domain-containing protein [Pseudomonas mosselii]MDH1718223.1 RHS repeat-associated core domain-containing protein [Pseudomonas mosselii]MDH1723840.1 RHS repeat-associated core domain-containing protein [Pseudomonas mosselii]ORT70436.1 hypothetical protein BTA49_11255 [Pseudomonas mosselii]
MATQMLLATDWSRSALQSLVSDQRKTTCYTPYGWRPGRDENTKTGFTGQICEPELSWYLLGNGHRGYNPALMRFSSPDHLSPFGKGGVNAYMYCHGAPVNYIDPKGSYLEAIKLMAGTIFGPKVVDHGMALVNMGNYTWNRRQAIKAGVDEARLPMPTSKRDAVAAGAGVVLGLVGLGIAQKNIAKVASGSGGGVTDIASLNVNGEHLDPGLTEYAGFEEVAEMTLLFSNAAINEVAGGLRYNYSDRIKQVAWEVEKLNKEVRVPMVEAVVTRAN